MKMLLRFLISVGALWLTLYLLDTFKIDSETTISADGFVPLAIAVVVMAIANTFVRPLLNLFALPLNCLTFGLFSFVINAFLFWAVGQVTGAFTVGWLGALVGSIAMGIITGVATNLLVDRGQE